MKLANLHLVTGYAGYEHVTAADQGAFNVALLGADQFVIDKGNKLAATVVTNNKIQIADGDIYMQGRYIRLNSGEKVDLVIDSGKSGYMRNDLIVARYTKNAETGVEEVNLAVIKGTNTTGTPADPAHTSGDIVEGKAKTNEMPLYRVPIDGLNVQDLVPLFTVKDCLIPHTAAEVGAVPTSRKVNGKALSSNITLKASDVDARPNTWMPNAAETGALALDGSGTMTGDINIQKTSPRVILTNGSTGAEVRISNVDNTAVMQAKESSDATSFRQLRLCNTKKAPAGSLKDVLQLYSTVSGEGTKSFLHTGNISEHGVAKIETGSYVGTGTCGPDSPTEITFGFVPKMLWVWANGDCPNGSRGDGYTLPCTNLTEEYKSVKMIAAYTNTIKMKMVGNTVYFYGTYGHWGDEEDGEDEDVYYYDSEDEQLNSRGITYYYMAIG